MLGEVSCRGRRDQRTEPINLEPTMNLVPTALRSSIARRFRREVVKASEAALRPRASAPFETLENRQMMSVTINGTAGPDTISVYPAVNGTFDITVNGVKTNTGTKPITNFIVNCQGGADNVFFSAGITLPTIISGGEGNDTI